MLGCGDSLTHFHALTFAWEEVIVVHFRENTKKCCQYYIISVLTDHKSVSSLATDAVELKLIAPSY